MTTKTETYTTMFRTENGYAKVADHEIAPFHRPDAEPNHTGHVWVEVKGGMVVHRFHLAPKEARLLAQALLKAADAVDA